MKRAVNLELGIALVGLAGYLVLFFASPLPSLRHDDGSSWRRAEFFQFLLVPEVLVAQWFGDGAALGIADRLPVILGASGLLGVSAAAGWIVLRLLRAHCGLTRLETLVFAVAVGLNLLSTYLLAVGLLGLAPCASGLAAAGARAGLFQLDRMAAMA